MIINISDIWEDASAQHYLFLETIIEEGLKELTNSYIHNSIRDFIQANRKSIITGSPNDLYNCILDYKNRFGKGLMHGCVSEKLGKIFNFGNFSKKSNDPWTAYNLCDLARYKICSYCQMVSTATSLPSEDGTGFRPPIDHYYSKSDYPYLSLTLSNFIPCCEKCNGPQMKHAKDFAKIHHLNPLADEESIEFRLSPVNINGNFAEFYALQLASDKYSLELVATKNIDISKNSIKTFQLKRRYAGYSNRAFYLARKSKGFAARKKSVDDNLDFEVELEDLLEFPPDKYKECEYGKARICVAKQFGVVID